jgi:dTMP kinase
MVRLFGSREFFRLWLGQVVSSMGDWLGFFAIVVIAERVGGASAEASIGLVVGARIVPGFFFATIAGVLVDRWDRKRTMIVCDISRGLVLATLPFIDTVWGLVLASFLLEIPTLFWSPAKEASVPNLVPADHLTTANSLSLVAAYGTFPLAGLIFAGLAKVADSLGRLEGLEGLRVDQATVAIWFDVVTFFVSAIVIATIALPKVKRTGVRGRISFGGTFRDIKEGWHFIFINPVVRSVMVGLGTGLVGGGMLVPLGPIFSRQVLGGGPAGFGLLLTALGTGVAAGIVTLSLVQRRVPQVRVFIGSVMIAGASLVIGASTSSLAVAFVAVMVLGICAGSVYVVGFTILHSSVDDELRGRIFSSLYTLVRLCLLISFAVGPFMAGLLDNLSGRFFDHEITAFGRVIELPGVRLTLWIAGLIMLVAGGLAGLALRGRAGVARGDTDESTGVPP